MSAGTADTPRSWALFEGVPSGPLQAVLSAARSLRFERGDHVFLERDVGDSVYLIESGHVAVRVTTHLGDIATLHVMGPGEHFGELALISDGPRSASVVVLDALQALVIRAEALNGLRDQHPTIDRALLRAVAGETRRLSAALRDAMYLPVQTRLARKLLDLCRVFAADPTGVHVIPLTQEDLAGLVGTTRPTVNQLLRDLDVAGTVILSRGKVAVRDRQALLVRARA